MKDTGYTLPDWDSSRLAHGFTDEGGDWGTMTDQVVGGDGPGWFIVGNGGIQSTVADMYRWHRALAGGKILTGEHLKSYWGGGGDILAGSERCRAGGAPHDEFCYSSPAMVDLAGWHSARPQ